MAVPKKRTSKSKKERSKSKLEDEKDHKAAQKSLSLAKSMLRTDVAELVYALGLGSSNFGYESSSLSIRIKLIYKMI
jgi:ribosomal protein L32